MVNKINLTKRRIFSYLLVWSLMCSGFMGIVLFSTQNAIAGAGQNLTVTGTYTVSGNEIWDDVIVKGTGKLIVPTATTLTVFNIFLETGSIFEATGGYISLTNSSASGEVNFVGDCKYFNVTNYSIINLTGANGGSSKSVSRGGDATLDVTASNGINIDNSTINITGGDGYDLPASTNSISYAWNQGLPLGGYVAAGGNATIALTTTNNADISIASSNLTANGGHGGRASDGGNCITYTTPGKGGGYNNGGIVFGRVGTGGNATISISSDNKLNIYDSSLYAKGGRGGDGGNGGYSTTANPPASQDGGGGGGYGGGDGGTYPAHVAGYNGGNIMEYVGSGGTANITLYAKILLIITNSDNITMIGGNGGDGGNGDHNGYGGGGGGGGYGGGGGSCNSYNSAANNNGGNGGIISEYVGTGGRAYFWIIPQLNFTLINSNITLNAGNGGDAGDGGSSINPGATVTQGSGGGGYGGGGGGGAQSMAMAGGIGGSGTVQDRVGTGGNCTAYLKSDDLNLINSNIVAYGGNGGNGGVGGGPTMSSGGGGYGGGGGSCANKGVGGTASVTGCVGDGGNALIAMNTKNNTFDPFSLMNAFGGLGGIGPTSPGAGATGGAGTGRVTSNGNGSVDFFNVPVVVNIQKSPNMVFRTNTINFYVNATDNSDPESALQCEMEYKLSSSVMWQTLSPQYVGTAPGGYWTTSFTPSSSAALGLYDFRVRFQDSDSNFGPWSSVTFIVLNNLPIGENIYYSGNILNRTQSINIYFNGTDIETAENMLICTAQYKPPMGTWTNLLGLTYITNRWVASLTPGANAQIGNYDIRVNFTDQDFYWSGWLTELGNVTVQNNFPVSENLEYSSSYVFRTESIIISTNGTDVETPEDQLICQIQYRSPSGSWTDLTGENFVTDHWDVTFSPAKTAELGFYDFRVDFFDMDSNSSDWLEGIAQVLVLNNRPQIINDDVITVQEDDYYSLSYSASDVETSELIWIYQSDTSWLNWGSLNHTIYGTPRNGDVGLYWVRINISDGDGGFDEHNFTLTVVNVNDAPIIDTDDILTATEDEYYEVLYSATDIDLGDVIIWSQSSDAEWLHWGAENHTLYGTPLNDDVGEYLVRINISDGNGGYDEHSFILTVENVNDAPTLTGAPTTIDLNALEDKDLDLTIYIEDVDNELSELTLLTDSNYGKVSGLGITFNYPVSVLTETVKITVSDGLATSAPHFILLTVHADDTIHPRITDKSPTGEDVPVETNITITFNKPMAQSTVEGAFSITPIKNGKISWVDKTMVFDSSLRFLYNTTYTITIDSTAADLDGNLLGAPYSWNFTTEIQDVFVNDTDYDGMPDAWEEAHGLNPNINDANGDPDTDGLTNIEEYVADTDPQDPDTDNDGYIDSRDKYPLDPTKWEDEIEEEDEEEEPSDEKKSTDFTWLILLVVLIIIIVSIIVFFIFIKRKKEMQELEAELKQEQDEPSGSLPLATPIAQPQPQVQVQPSVYPQYPAQQPPPLQQYEYPPQYPQSPEQQQFMPQTYQTQYPSQPQQSQYPEQQY